MREPHSGLDAAALVAARAYKVARRSVVTAVRAVVATEARLLGTKRRRLITAASAVALILAIVGTTATISTIDQQNTAAAAVVAQKKADLAEAKAAAEAEAAKEVADAEALADAKASSITVSDEAIAKAAAAATWADPAVLAEVEAARLALVESAKGSDAGAIQLASFAVHTALVKIGTIEASQDRAYTAARVAAGRTSYGDDASSAKAARTYCGQLDEFYAADVSKSVTRFLEHWTGVSEDTQAIAVYCPRYQPVIDALPSKVDDGKYAVGDVATPYGTTPRTIAAGTYAMGPVADCYWERSTGAGGIIDNDFVGNSVSGFTVSINSGEGFTARGCGVWVKQ